MREAQYLQTKGELTAPTMWPGGSGGWNSLPALVSSVLSSERHFQRLSSIIPNFTCTDEKRKLCILLAEEKPMVTIAVLCWNVSKIERNMKYHHLDLQFPSLDLFPISYYIILSTVSTLIFHPQAPPPSNPWINKFPKYFVSTKMNLFLPIKLILIELT